MAGGATRGGAGVGDRSGRGRRRQGGHGRSCGQRTTAAGQRCGRPAEVLRRPDPRLAAVVGGEEVGRQIDRGGDAAARGAVQVDADAVAGGEVAGDVVAQVLGRGDRERLGAREAPVGRRDVLARHAEARVDDRDRVAAGVPGTVAGAQHATDLDDPVGRREHEGVLDQLGQQVGEVGGHRPEHGGGRQAAHRDPLVVLDLAEGGADDVGEPHGGGPLAGRLDAGQHQQRLGVAAHAGGEVVEPEQAGQRVGVGLLRLELGDEVELAAEQVLVAAAEVDEAVGDVAAQHGLLDGQVERRVLHGVQRLGDVRHLVPGVHAHRRHRRHHDVVAERGLEDLGHRVGQPPIGHVLGLPGQRPQRAGDRQGDDDRQRHGRAERHDHQQRERWSAGWRRPSSARPPVHPAPGRPRRGSRGRAGRHRRGRRGWRGTRSRRSFRP